MGFLRIPGNLRQVIASRRDWGDNQDLAYGREVRALRFPCFDDNRVST